MSSKIEQIIEEIEEYIDGCKPQTLSKTNIVVNKEEIEELLRELREVSGSAALAAIGKNSRDMGELRGAVKSAVSGYLFKHTKRSPMVIPVVNRIG